MEPKKTISEKWYRKRLLEEDIILIVKALRILEKRPGKEDAYKITRLIKKVDNREPGRPRRWY